MMTSSERKAISVWWSNRCVKRYRTANVAMEGVRDIAERANRDRPTMITVSHSWSRASFSMAVGSPESVGIVVYPKSEWELMTRSRAAGREQGRPFVVMYCGLEQEYSRDCVVPTRELLAECEHYMQYRSLRMHVWWQSRWGFETTL